MNEQEMDLTPEEELSNAILEQDLSGDEGYDDAPQVEKERPMKKKKKKKGMRVFLIVTCSILALVLLLMVVATAMVYRWLGMINRTDGYLPPLSEDEMQAYLDENTDPYDPN